MKKVNWIVIIVLALAGTLFLAQVIMMTFTNSDISDTLREGRIETYFNGDAVIIRSEKVLKTSTKDYLAPAVPSGEKVSKGELVARSCSQTSLATLAEYEKAQEKLSAEIRKSVMPVTATSYEVNKINKTIDEKILGLMLSNTSESFENALTFERDIRKLTDDKIQKVLDTLTNSSLVELKKNADALNKAFYSSSGAVKSDESGVVSFVVDGYETKFTPEGINKITENDIEGVKNINQVGNESKNINSLKIIKNFNAYIAINVDKEFADSIIVNSFREIRINDVSEVLNGRLVVKKPGQKNKTLLVFKIDRGIEKTCDLRKVNIDIAKGRTTTVGLKIPKESLLTPDYKNMTAKVALIRAHTIVIRNVEIVDFDGSYAVIKDVQPDSNKAVELFEEYIKKPQSVKEGELVQ